MAMRTNDERLAWIPQGGGARGALDNFCFFFCFFFNLPFFFDFYLFFSSTCLVGLEGQTSRAYDAGLAGTARGWSGQQDDQRNGTTNPSMIVPSHTYRPAVQQLPLPCIHKSLGFHGEKEKREKTTQLYFTPVPWRPHFVLFTILYSFLPFLCLHSERLFCVLTYKAALILFTFILFSLLFVSFFFCLGRLI